MKRQRDYKTDAACFTSRILATQGLTCVQPKSHTLKSSATFQFKNTQRNGDHTSHWAQMNCLTDYQKKTTVPGDTQSVTT